MHVSTARPPDRDEFREERCRRFTPERLDVLETCGARALFIPAAHVGEMDVAEHDAATALPHGRGERVPQRRVERIRVSRHADQ
jgi:hypothetical protein